MQPTRTLSHGDYTVGWICALPLELAAATAMLDESHAKLPQPPHDHNTYTLGTISGHNVAIACLPSGSYGTTSAAAVAAHMCSTFLQIRFGLLVGIGGGVPGRQTDIRLGDVVVSKPTDSSAGVEQYDYGKTVAAGHFQRTGALNKPPQGMLTAIAKLQASNWKVRSRITEILSEIVAKDPEMSPFTCRSHQDLLFDAEYDHVNNGEPCESCCDLNKIVPREVRANQEPQIHYGIIASGNQVMKHGLTRDRIAQGLGILCFEMEAAGIMDHFPSLVIRGICDYADSHKNKQWQEYAAITAAAYAKELLSVTPVTALNSSCRMTVPQRTVLTFELFSVSQTSKHTLICSKCSFHPNWPCNVSPSSNTSQLFQCRCAQDQDMASNISRGRHEDQLLFACMNILTLKSPNHFDDLV